MMGAQTGTNLMALLAFPNSFWIGGDDSLGFIVLAIIAGFAAMCIHATTFLTVKEPSDDQGIERVGGSLLEAAKAIGKKMALLVSFLCDINCRYYNNILLEII